MLLSTLTSRPALGTSSELLAIRHLGAKLFIFRFILFRDVAFDAITGRLSNSELLESGRAHLRRGVLRGGFALLRNATKRFLVIHDEYPPQINILSVADWVGA
jgi:hypothetical protein